MSDLFSLNQEKSFTNNKFKLENEKKHYGTDFFSDHTLNRQIKKLKMQNEDSVNFLQIYDCYDNTNTPNQSVILTNCASRNTSNIKSKEGTGRISKIDEIKKQIMTKQSQFTQGFFDNNSLLKTGIYETGTVDLNSDLPNISSFNSNLRKSSKPFANRKRSEESCYSSSVIFELNSSIIKDKKLCFNDLPYVLKTSSLQNASNLYVNKKNSGKQKDYTKLYDKIFCNKKMFKSEKPKNEPKFVNGDVQYFKSSGNPYINEKLKEIQTKVTFIKGVYDYAYPQVMLDKIKYKKLYNEKFKENNKIHFRNTAINLKIPANKEEIKSYNHKGVQNNIELSNTCISNNKKKPHNKNNEASELKICNTNSQDSNLFTKKIFFK